MPKIIGITGMPSSGKTTATKLIKSKKIKKIHLGDFIWNYLKSKKIRRTQETGNMASLYFWAEYQDIPIAEWAYEKIKNSNFEIYIVDGIRTVEELHFFRKKFKDNFKLISVVTSPKIRKSREEKRKRFSDIDFQIRDKEELTIGVGEVIALSDYYIIGNGTKKQLMSQLDKVLKQITVKKSL